VAVHPDDDRFKEFIGQKLILPVVNREIPVIGDARVDREFGTGAVKVTPAHDPNDFETGLRHGLEQVCVMHEDGRMNENAGDYSGMDRYECREALVEELRQKGLLEAVEPHVHSVGHCYRCHTVIEPYLSDQWFVKMRPLADAALKASDDGRVRFYPGRWDGFYRSWLENVRDWCISRQIWWGHRLPAWYCNGCGHITVSRADPDRCEKCKSADIRQDEDVLDTWFSSALWPFSTLGWPEKTEMLEKYYPTSVLVTDRGIIYFWVARMVMMGLEMLEEVPFRHVYINGTILDEIGRKMSKSLGNGIDPVDIIETYGADAMRFSLIMLTVEGQDVKLSADRFEMGRNYANKMWNAARFVLMNLSGGKGCAGELELEDRWILSRLQGTVATVTRALENYQFNEAIRSIYEFSWNEFCDWYLEIIKPRLRAQASVARKVLSHTMDTLLRLLHPFTPFFTEEVWQHLRERTAEGDLDWEGAVLGESLMVARWPTVEEAYSDGAAEDALGLLQDIIRAVRNIRSKLGVGDRKALDVVISVPEQALADTLIACEGILRDIGHVQRATIGVGLAKPAQSAMDVVGRVQVFVPLEGVTDLSEERKRLDGRIGEIQRGLDLIERKLSNEDFVRRAPEEVVARERARKADFEAQIAKLRQSQAELDDA